MYGLHLKADANVDWASAIAQAEAAYANGDALSAKIGALYQQAEKMIAASQAAAEEIRQQIQILRGESARQEQIYADVESIWLDADEPDDRFMVVYNEIVRDLDDAIDDIESTLEEAGL